MTTVISFIIVFGLIVSIHELGHLILAKRAGILCREFAIGFGPKLFSYKKNETVYTIRLLPLGGYVRMAGEDPEMIQVKTGQDIAVLLNEQGKVKHLIFNKRKEYPEARVINVTKVDLERELFVEGYNVEEEIVRYEIDPKAMMVQDHQETQIAPYDRQFGSKTVGQRAAAIFAGPLANFLLAFVILFAFAIYNGIPTKDPQIGEVLPETAAQEAGLEAGDVIIAINGDPIDSWNELVAVISANPRAELELVIQRGGQQVELQITPDVRQAVDLDGEYEIGFIGVSPPMERTFIGSLEYGATQTVDFALLIFRSIGMLISGAIPLDDLAGPVGIFDFTGQAAQAGLPVLLQWTAILSVNLGIFNLLPIPALDGGRLMFIGLEALRGRPVDPHKEGMVHFIGFALLMLLILVVTWNDIQRLFFN